MPSGPHAPDSDRSDRDRTHTRPGPLRIVPAVARSSRTSRPARQFQLTVGAIDDPEEREADRIADAVISHLAAHSGDLVDETAPTAQPPRVRRSALASGAMDALGGGPVAPDVEASIRGSVGAPLESGLRRRFESAFGADFGVVRIHANSAAAPALQADAFAQGSDIHVAPGLYQPDTAAGRHLLAHELAHVVQQRGTLARIPLGASAVIRRSLRGTYDSLVAVHDEKGFRFGKTHGSWTDTLQAVKRYEALEAKSFSGGNISKWKARKKELHAGLDAIAKHAKAWLTEHEADVVASATGDTVMQGGDISALGADAQMGVRKLSAIRNLLRKVAWERTEITRHRTVTPHRDDQVIQGPVQDDAAGGQASRLDKLGFQPNNNAVATVGYYQADVATAPVRDSAAGATGIPGLDPNFAGRSMAAARLDKLITTRMVTLGATVAHESLVPMDFATHTRTPNGGVATATSGVYLEEARGEAARARLDVGQATPTEAARTGVQQIAFDDPVLMRSLNKLQILDAICGQVDRHAGNFFVSQDAGGRVTGVQGIDNDMAFGDKMRGDASGMRAQAAQATSADLVLEGRAWRGLPPIADQEVANAVQNITAADLRAAIDGLISPAEIDATVDRLLNTQQFLGTLGPLDLIAPADWNARRATLSQKQQSFNSYLGAARTEGVGALTTAAMVVKGKLAAAMAAARAVTVINMSKPAALGGQGTVPEFLFAENQIYNDVQNLVGRGSTEAVAIQRGEVLAGRYAQTVAIAQVDRSNLNMKKAMETVDAPACARALEQSRRTMYAIWG